MWHFGAKLSKSTNHLANQTLDFEEIKCILLTHTSNGLNFFFKVGLKYCVTQSNIIPNECNRNVFLLSFETDVNRIPSSPKRAMANIYMLLDWWKLRNGFSTTTLSFYSLPLPILNNYGKSSIPLFKAPLQLDRKEDIRRQCNYIIWVTFLCSDNCKFY